MAEEEDVFELLANDSTSAAEHRHAPWATGMLNDCIFLSMVAMGLSAHILAIYTIAASRRLQTRTNVVIMHWMLFETATQNVLYPLMHFWHVYAFNYILHMMFANVLLATFYCTLFLLNVLASDAFLTKPNDAVFRRYVERFYVTFGAVLACMLLWKAVSVHQMYVEFLLLVIVLATTVLLVVRVLWRQSCRVLGGCQRHADVGADLRLHLATFFIIAKMLTIILNVASIKYRSGLLSHLSRFWCLSGFYVLAVLSAKDVTFKIVLGKVLGCKQQDAVTADDDNIIASSEDALAETRIQCENQEAVQ